MAHIASSLVAFASDHAGLADALAFLLAASESFPGVPPPSVGGGTSFAGVKFA
jgi:hypothetical protein